MKIERDVEFDIRFGVTILVDECNISKSAVNSIVTEDLGDQETWRFHRDSALSHTGFFVTDYSAKSGMATLLEPPYKSNLVLPNFLYPRIKTENKGHHFRALEVLNEATTRYLKKGPR